MTGLDDAPTAIVNQLTADEYFDGNETELQLQKAIASLPDKQRAVFHLKYYEQHIKHQRRRLKSLLPSCREKNMRFF